MEAVIGSRKIKNFDFSSLNLTNVISGGAIGIDTAVAQYCKASGIPITEIIPNYKKYGKQAPILRNIEIVELCTELFAIWDGKSRGTKFTIDYARKKSKKVTIILKNETT